MVGDSAFGCESDVGAWVDAAQLGGFEKGVEERRDLYRCKPCGTLFNTGEYETPQYAELAAMLAAPDAYPCRLSHLDGGALVYHVNDNGEQRVGIEHLVSGAPIRIEKADALEATRYLIDYVPDYLDPLTLQHEREHGTHVPLTMGELECFADLYNGAYQLAGSRYQS